MSKLKKIKNNVKKTRFFWLYYILGAIAIIISILFAPFWKEINTNIPMAYWYEYCLGLLIGISIFIYIFTILLRRIKSPGHGKVIRVLMGLEFAFMVVLATFCILESVLHENEQFRFFNTLEILSFVIWIRGFVEIINAYYYEKESQQKYPIWFLMINIFLISVGPILFVIGFKYHTTIDLVVSYIFTFLLLFLGSFLMIWGFLSRPIKINEEIIVEETKNTNNDEALLVDDKEKLPEIKE